MIGKSIYRLIIKWRVRNPTDCVKETWKVRGLLKDGSFYGIIITDYEDGQGTQFFEGVLPPNQNKEVRELIDSLRGTTLGSDRMLFCDAIYEGTHTEAEIIYGAYDLGPYNPDLEIRFSQIQKLIKANAVFR